MSGLFLNISQELLTVIIIMAVVFLVASVIRAFYVKSAKPKSEKRKRADPVDAKVVLKDFDRFCERAATGDISALPYVFCAFAGEDRSSKQKAAEVFADVLDKADAGGIFKIYAAVRNGRGFYGVSWRACNLDGVLTAVADTRQKRAVCIISSFHYNGYLREQAVKILAATEGSLPYLMIRTGDWVREVRVAAKAAFEYRLTACGKEEFAISAAFAERVFKGNNQLKKAYIDAIMKDEAVFSACLSSPDVYARRFCIDAFFLYGNPLPENEVRLLCGERDPFLRYRIYSKAVGLSEFNKEVILFSLDDKHPKIRFAALASAWNKGYVGIERIKPALTDKNTAIRNFAQHIMLAGDDPFDLSEYYRRYISNPAAICGLGEAGDRSDCALLEQLLQSGQPQTVRAAMKSLCMLNFDEYAGEIAKMLGDGRCGVVKEAYNLLRKRTGGVLHTVKRIYDGAESPYIKKKCALLLFSSSKWGGLAYMLQALLDSAVAELAAQKIIRWYDGYNSSFVRPSFSERKQLLDLIDRNKQLLGKDMTERLLFCIG